MAAAPADEKKQLIWRLGGQTIGAAVSIMKSIDAKTQEKLLLFVVCAIVFLLGFETGGFQLALLQAATEFKLDGFRMGLLVAAQYASISIMPLIFGRVSDRVGKKKVITIFMIVFIVGCTTSGMRGTSTQFIIGIIILGAGYSVCECTATAALADAFGSRSGKNINLSQSFFSLGAFLSPLVLKFLSEQFLVSWRGCFVLCAIFMSAILPIMPLLHIKPAPKAAIEKFQVNIGKRTLLPALVFCMFIYVGVETGIAFFADTVFTLELNMPSMGAYAISVFWAMMGIMRFIFGNINRSSRRAAPVSLFCLTCIIIAMMFCNSKSIMLCLFAAAGLACGCVWPSITSTATALFPISSGAVASYLMVGGGLGGALMPAALGAAMSIAGVTGAFILMVIPSLFTGLLLWFGFENAEFPSLD